MTAVAQEGEVIEEIITTGIRGSLTRSMDIKRASRGVVDAISAEDIGKFPDANLAESLEGFRYTVAVLSDAEAL